MQINNLPLDTISKCLGVDIKNKMGPSACAMADAYSSLIPNSIYSVIASYTNGIGIVYKTLIKNLDAIMEKCPASRLSLARFRVAVESGLFSMVNDRCPKCTKGMLGNDVTSIESATVAGPIRVGITMCILMIIIAFIVGILVSKYLLKF